MAISDSEQSKRTKNCSTSVECSRASTIENLGSRDGSNMEYDWMEPKRDPIVTDTNLAEIDFEDFRNEDLAYAFSCGVRIR